jgi:hypothetical protein
MATTKRPAKKAAKKGARKPTRTATRKPATKAPKAAKKATKKAVKKSAKRTAAASRSAARSRTPKTPTTRVTREPEPFAIHLPFDKYAEFARAFTAGASKTYYGSDKQAIADYIENFLRDQNNGAKVLINCNGDNRPFSANDRIKVEVDNVKDGKYSISIPSFICENAAGEVDIAYLEAYVRQIQAANVTQAAWALLGMYFLSRCR